MTRQRGRVLVLGFSRAQWYRIEAALQLRLPPRYNEWNFDDESEQTPARGWRGEDEP